MSIDLEQLRRQCPLPVLMNRLGYGQFARSSCPSPFRNDQNASWGIFQHNGRWLFKDFATGECGDEIRLLAKLTNLDPKQDFIQLLDRYSELAQSINSEHQMKLPAEARRCELPDQLFLRDGTEAELKRLADLRGISYEGLHYAQLRGVLQFGKWWAGDVFAVTDRSGYLGEIRRLDGQVFSGSTRLPGYKSHTLKFSRKNWPLGILEANGCTGIALVEGLPDFLAAHQFVIEEGLSGKVAPVAMLTSSCGIVPEALPHFAGKSVRIFPHSDGPGIEAAEVWQRQLLDAGAKHIDFFDFQAFEVKAGPKPKDLCDFNRYRRMVGYTHHILNSLAL